jgi:hypothetical protein
MRLVVALLIADDTLTAWLNLPSSKGIWMLVALNKILIIPQIVQGMKPTIHVIFLPHISDYSGLSVVNARVNLGIGIS